MDRSVIGYQGRSRLTSDSGSRSCSASSTVTGRRSRSGTTIGSPVLYDRPRTDARRKAGVGRYGITSRSTPTLHTMTAGVPSSRRPTPNRAPDRLRLRRGTGGGAGTTDSMVTSHGSCTSRHRSKRSGASRLSGCPELRTRGCDRHRADHPTAPSPVGTSPWMIAKASRSRRPRRLQAQPAAVIGVDDPTHFETPHLPVTTPCSTTRRRAGVLDPRQRRPCGRWNAAAERLKRAGPLATSSRPSSVPHPVGSVNSPARRASNRRASATSSATMPPLRNAHTIAGPSPRSVVDDVSMSTQALVTGPQRRAGRERDPARMAARRCPASRANGRPAWRPAAGVPFGRRDQSERSFEPRRPAVAATPRHLLVRLRSP